MFTPPSAVLHGMLLLAAPTSTDTQPPLPHCEAGTRHIELTAEVPGETPEVCIRPELSLSLLFDVKLAGVEVAGRERFRRVDEAASSLTLVPSELLHDGERIPVTVSFQEDTTPTRATFILVVHPSQAERQVEVSRHTRTVDSFRQGEQQARAEAQQCREEKVRLQAECGGRGGLTALIVDGWLDEQGVLAQRLKGLVSRPGDLITAQDLVSYRAVGPTGRGRIAVTAALFNRGTTAWTPAGASLVSAHSETLADVRVWILEPIAPGKPGRIIIEADATDLEARGPFTLKLWGAPGLAGARVDGVTFP